MFNVKPEKTATTQTNRNAVVTLQAEPVSKLEKQLFSLPVGGNISILVVTLLGTPAQSNATALP